MLPSLRSLLLLTALALAVTARAEPLPNTECPVMGEKALPQFSLVHEDQRVFFCCETCLDDFRANPAAYLAKLPQFSGPSAASPNQMRFAGIALLVLAVGGLVVVLRRRAKLPAPGLRLAAVVLAPLLVGGLVFAVLLIRKLERDVERFELRHDIHFATFYDFGYPPVPVKPPIAPRLEGTFYRGNDERDPALFNGGNYLTSTFDLSIVDGEGKKVKAGDQVADKPLFVSFIIRRAPFTPDFFFDAPRMAKVYVTGQMGIFLGSESDPVLDRVGLTALEPNQRWESKYPIGPFPADQTFSSERILYVAEEQYYDGVLEGSRFHYAIQYDLELEKGAVLPESDLWMGALVRTRKVTIAKLPLSEWFSHLPIPEKPSMGTQDPELLGIDDDSRPASELPSPTPSHP